MAQERWMRKVGNSWVVAVPPRVRAHLGLKHAGHLYWHLKGPKEVILTPHPQRVGGKPAGQELAPALDAARRRIVELEAKLAAQPEATLRKFRMQEWLTRFRLEVSGLPEFTAINDRLRRIEDQLGTRRGPWSYRVTRARPRKTEAVPAPVLDAPILEETHA
jgi:antitoxin component of MazEF toxin-antitoxin module